MPPVTYSPAVTLVLTHDCPWHCRYCGFRTDGEGLVSEETISAVLQRGREQGATEVLLISGERPGSIPAIRAELEARGFEDFTAFACHAAHRILEAGLLPHGNYGALGSGDLARLRTCHVSMGLMLENVEDLPSVAPEKRSRGRLATLRAAGELHIPFTSGILIGLGESQASRRRSLEALADLHRTHGHLQEIIIQNYVPNSGSTLDPAPTPELEDYLELIHLWRELAPGVAVQVPPNLNPHWRALIPHLDDLGGISLERDEVNPERPWQPAAVYAEAVRAAGRELKARLPVYPRFINETWIDSSLLRHPVWGDRQKSTHRASPAENSVHDGDDGT